MAYDLYRKRFLCRFSFIRLRRLCLAIFAFLLFFSEPIMTNQCWYDLIPDQPPVVN